MMMAAHDAQGGGTGSARRRRERRLRSMLRHERMSVAMALAEKLHHSAQRPEMARAGGGARVEVHGRVPEDAPPPGGRCGVLRDGHRGRMTVPHLPPRGQHR